MKQLRSVTSVRRKGYLILVFLLLILGAALAKEFYARYAVTDNLTLKILFIDFLTSALWSVAFALCTVFLYKRAKCRLHSRQLSLLALFTLVMVVLLPIANVFFPRGGPARDLFDEFCAAAENPLNREVLVAWANAKLIQYGDVQIKIPSEEIPAELFAMRPTKDAVPEAIINQSPANPSRFVAVSYYSSGSTRFGLVVGWQDIANFPKAIEKTRSLKGGIIAFEDFSR